MESIFPSARMATFVATAPMSTPATAIRAHLCSYTGLSISVKASTLVLICSTSSEP